MSSTRPALLQTSSRRILAVGLLRSVGATLVRPKGSMNRVAAPEPAGTVPSSTSTG